MDFTMMSLQAQAAVAIILTFATLTFAKVEGIHIPVHRRGGRFSVHEVANLPQLAQALSDVEARYARSYLDVEQNGLVRRWHQKDSTVEDVAMYDGIGRIGNWHASIIVGDPAQKLDFELDMLHPDFFTLITTSEKGQRYNTTDSKTHGHSEDYVHPMCRKTTDTFHLEQSIFPHRLELAVCTPPQSTVHTLLTQGSVLGLGPFGSLSRLPSSSITAQLRTQKFIKEPLWSLTLLDSISGILSFGTTLVSIIEKAKAQADLELKNMGQPHATADWIQSQIKPQLDLIEALPWQEHFKWADVKGAKGWWTALMSGLWVNGAKVLRNQPVIFDLQCPFIIAPPTATERVYESVGGAFRLPEPDDQFFAFPCLNAVNVAFEIGGWNFPVLSGEGLREDILHGPSGGKFSLGMMNAGGNATEEVGTGYCVGVIMETKMGIRKDWESVGLQDTWVIGEPFFRSTGVVFDQGNGRIGLRSY